MVMAMTVMIMVMGMTGDNFSHHYHDRSHDIVHSSGHGDNARQLPLSPHKNGHIDYTTNLIVIISNDN